MSSVMVRNNEKGPTVFTDHAENVQLEWQGSGDPEGRDVQRVPQKVMENVEFLRAVDRGIYSVIQSSPDTDAKMASQAEGYRARRDQSNAVTEAAIDRETERSLITVEIDEKGAITSQSNEPSPRPQQARDTALSVPAETEQHDEEGKPIETSIPVIMDAPQRQS